jgi:hypothetical protein
MEDELNTTSHTRSTALKAAQDRRAWKVLSETHLPLGMTVVNMLR